MLQEAPQRSWLAFAQGQAPVGQEHKYAQMVNLLMLLQQAKGFRPEAALEAPIRVHLHLQEHHRQRCAAAAVLAGPKHAIGVVGHLFEGNGPEDVVRFAVAALGGGQPGQEMTHQVRQSLEDFGKPMIAVHGIRDGRRAGR